MSVPASGGAPAQGDGAPDKVLVFPYAGQEFRIYRSAPNGREVFTVRYSVPGEGSKRKSCASLYEMIVFILTIPDAQAQAANSKKVLYGQEAVAYDQAMALLKPTGMAIDRVVEDYVAQCARLGTRSLHEAVTHYLAVFPDTLKEIAVKDLIRECLEWKRYKAESSSYYRELFEQLLRYLEAKRGLLVMLHRVTTVDLQEWVESPCIWGVRKGAQASWKTRTHRRASAVTLLNFAKKRGYLKLGHPTAAEALPDVERPKGKPSVGIFQPEHIEALLQLLWPKILVEKKRQQVLHIVLGAFGGVRPQEISRMTWSMVNFDENTIYLPGEITKTGFFREFSMQPNLRAFLEVLRMGAEGRIVYPHVAKPVRCLAQNNGIPWPYDGLRHSYGTYLLAKTNDEGLVIQSMGTSRYMLMNSYRGRVASRAAVARYWRIGPPGWQPPAEPK